MSGKVVTASTIVNQLKQRQTYVPSTEAMSILGVTRQTLCKWVNTGRIAAIRIGKDNKFDPAHLAVRLEVSPLTLRDIVSGSTIIERLKQRKTFVSSTETMRILGVTRQALCRWVNAGRIAATRIGNANKFDPAYLAVWLEERQIGHATVVQGRQLTRDVGINHANQACVR